MPHHYYFRLHALDAVLYDVPARAKKVAIMRAMQGHVLAKGELMGVYERHGEKAAGAR